MLLRILKYITSKKLLLWNGILMLTVVVSIIPLSALFTDLLNFDAILFSIILKSALLRYIGHTLVIVVIVGSIVIIIGSAIAWITAMYCFPFRRLLIYAQILPLLMPAYISAITWKDAFSPQGFMAQWFGSYLASLPSFIVLVGVLVCNLYPYVFLILYVLFSNMPQSLIDAARTISHRKRNIFFTIGLPYAKTSLIGATLLVIMELLNGYWVYQYLGYEIITTGVVRTWQLYDSLAMAKLFSAGIVLSVMVLVMMKNSLEHTQHKIHFTKSYKIVPRPLARHTQCFAICVCALPILIGFVIPTIQLLAWGVPIIVSRTVEYSVVSLLLNTLLIVSLVIIIQIPLAILLSYAVQLNRKPIYRTLYSILSLGYAIPSAIVAILIIAVIRWVGVLFPSIPTFSIFVNNGIYAMVVACVYRYLPIALTSIGAGFHNTNKRFEQAARSLGSGTLRTLSTVCVPINFHFILTATMLTVIDIIKDIPIVSMLHPFNFSTIALKMYTLVNDEKISQSSIAGLMLVLLGIVITFPMYIGLIKRGELGEQ